MPRKNLFSQTSKGFFSQDKKKLRVAFDDAFDQELIAALLEHFIVVSNPSKDEFDVLVVVGALQRSIPLLQAINIGAEIVDWRWIDDANDQNRLSEEYDKFPPDAKQLEQYKLTFDNIIEARESKILSGKAVIVQKTCQEAIRHLVEKAGGKIVAVNAYNKAEVIVDSEQGLQER